MAIPSANPPAGSRRDRVPLRAAAAAALVAFAAASAAGSMQENPADAVPLERLRFEYKCIYQVAEWRGRGEERFLERLKTQKDAYRQKKPGEVGALEVLLADALWVRKGDLEAKKDFDGASRMASEVLALESKDPAVEKLKVEADEFILSRNLDQADKFLKTGDLARARETYETCLRTRKDDVRTKVVTAVVDIAKQQVQFDDVLKRQDLAEMGTMLQSLVASLQKSFGDRYAEYRTSHPSVKEVEAKRAEVSGSTGTIEVQFLDVSSRLGSFRGAVADLSLEKATFTFTPVGTEGRAYPPKGVAPKLPRPRFLWHKGVYDVRVFAPGGGEKPVATFPGVALNDPDKPTAVLVPSKAPAGMVWCPPSRPGGEALFVDRFEVTVAQVKATGAADGDGTKLGEVIHESGGEKAEDDLPAWILDEEAALAYEKASGKAIPTVDQWLQAAFAAYSVTQRPFPWGTEPPDASRAFAGKPAEPSRVGGRPAGASACGAEDMAGNLAEWVKQGGRLWTLGGNYLLDTGELTSLGGRNPLRDPRPGKTAFSEMSSDQQGSYGKYKVDESELHALGLRMVIPVPTK